MPQRKVYVVGAGMTKFERPGKRDWDYPDMGKEAGTKALNDAGIDYRLVEQAVVGYVYGDSTCGQRAVYGIGLTGIPIYNVNNNCSTGSTALYMAKQLVAGGQADCVMALGFDKMERGSLGSKFTDRTNPLDQHMNVMNELRGFAPAPPAPQMFGNAGREHMEKFGTTKEHFAKIAEKNHNHSMNNPYSQFRDKYTLEQILKSPVVYEPLTKLQCCPTSDGAAAVILASEDFVRKHGLEGQAVEIIGMAMATDLPSSFQDKSCIKMVGFDMSKKAAESAFQQAGVTPNDVQVVELHDCFSCNELITYEALGLAAPGKGGSLVDSGNVTYGGKWVVNPSGGLISKGHPLGATGLAQCSELYWQLRGMAGNRQVKNAKVALQHNIGLGGAVVVSLYRLGFPDRARPYPANKPNPAVDPNANFGGMSAVPTAGEFRRSAMEPVPTAASSAKAKMVFDGLQQVIASNPAVVKEIAGVYQFNIKTPSGEDYWSVDLKNAPGGVKNEKAQGAGVTLTIDEDNFVSMMTGQANSQQLFMQGKLKIAGNMGLAMKLGKLQSLAPKAAPAAAPAAAAAPAKPAAAPAAAPASSGAKSAKAKMVFDGLQQVIASNPAVVKEIAGVYQFNIKTPSGEDYWSVDLKNAPGGVKNEKAQGAGVTLTIDEDNFVSMMTGQANSQQLFMQGKLKIAGNMGLAMKLGKLQSLAPKAAPAAAPAAAAAPAKPAAAPASSGAKNTKSAVVFDGLAKVIASNPSLVKEIGGIYQFNIKGAAGEEFWAIDLKNGSGSVKPEKAASPGVTLSTDEDSFVAMMTGKANSQQLFMQGKLKIAGNMGLAMKLGKLQSFAPKL